MTTSKPIELGRASEETKEVGLEQPDHVGPPTGDKPL